MFLRLENGKEGLLLGFKFCTGPFFFFFFFFFYQYICKVPPKGTRISRCMSLAVGEPPRLSGLRV